MYIIKKKINKLTPKELKMLFFYCYRYEKYILGSIHKAAGGRHVASPTLLENLSHDERDLGPNPIFHSFALGCDLT